MSAARVRTAAPAARRVAGALLAVALQAGVLLASARAGQAQPARTGVAAPADVSADAPLDSTLVALTYHKLTGEPLDVRAAAERGEAVRRASGFDRPDVLAAESAQLERARAAADPARVFVVRVGDIVSEYDHARGEFSVQLFTSGAYVPVTAFRQQYRLVFANAEAARAIRMDNARARAFDAWLAADGRRVTDEVRFRVVGAGDPAGAVTGPRVVRAHLVAVRVLGRNGRVLFASRLTDRPNAAAVPLDPARTDVAGFRVGVKAADLEPTLRRLFGPVTRRPRGRDWYPGFAAALAVNESGCYAIPGRGRGAEPGAVCVTAYLDDRDVVRSLRVERVFPHVAAELFRRTLVRRYGPVAAASEGAGYALGWGPAVDRALVYDAAGPRTAMAAYYVENSTFLSRGLNAPPPIRVVLQLVDARWAAGRSAAPAR